MQVAKETTKTAVQAVSEAAEPNGRKIAALATQSMSTRRRGPVLKQKAFTCHAYE